MLVLSRQVSQKIVIGSGQEAITIMVVKIDNDKVRIGIDAPRNVPVHREEIHDKIAAELNSPEKLP